MSDEKKDGNRTTIIVALIGMIGVVLAASIGAYATIYSNQNHSVTPTPTPLPDPAIFVRSYFNELWQTRDYDYMWSHDLTPKFQAIVVPKGENDFIQTWTGMQKIDVNHVTITSHQSDTAVSVRVNLAFYKKGESPLIADYSYDLTYNANLATWQFDVH